MSSEGKFYCTHFIDEVAERLSKFKYLVQELKARKQ